MILMKKLISIRLSEAVVEKIEDKMRQLSLGKTAVIEKALEEYLQKKFQEWPDERLERLRLIRLLLISEQPDIEKVKEEVEKLWGMTRFQSSEL